MLVYRYPGAIFGKDQPPLFAEACIELAGYVPIYGNLCPIIGFVFSLVLLPLVLVLLHLFLKWLTCAALCKTLVPTILIEDQNALMEM